MQVTEPPYFLVYVYVYGCVYIYIDLYLYVYTVYIFLYIYIETYTALQVALYSMVQVALLVPVVCLAILFTISVVSSWILPQPTKEPEQMTERTMACLSYALWDLGIRSA